MLFMPFLKKGIWCSLLTSTQKKNSMLSHSFYGLVDFLYVIKKLFLFSSNLSLIVIFIFPSLIPLGPVVELVNSC